MHLEINVDTYSKYCIRQERNEKQGWTLINTRKFAEHLMPQTPQILNIIYLTKHANIPIVYSLKTENNITTHI